MDSINDHDMTAKLNFNYLIHILYTLNLTRVHSGAGAYPSCPWMRGGVYPEQVTTPSHRDKQPSKQSRCMFYGQWREAGETHTYTGRT